MPAVLLETGEEQLSRTLESGQLGADLQGREVVKIEDDLSSLWQIPGSVLGASSASSCWKLLCLSLACAGVLEAKLWEAAGSELERLWMRLLEVHQTGVGVFQLFAASHSKVTCEGQRMGSEAPQSFSAKPFLSSPLP